MTQTSTQRHAVVQAIATEVAQLDLGHPVRVAVDGITAVGKTTFADELADAVAALDRPCRRVSMDGFRHPRVTRYRQGRESPGGYYEDAYDFDALRRELLDPLGEGGSRRYRTAIIDLAADTPLDRLAQPADERLVVIVDGSFLQRGELDGAWDRTVFLSSTFDAARERGATRDAEHLGSRAVAERLFTVRYHAAQQRYLAEADPERRASIVVEHSDPQRPVIRSAAGEPGRTTERRIAETRAFFGPRAAGWNDRFAEDDPAFARAVEELHITAGSTVVDVGCGAGRALPHLDAAVGPDGVVIGMDVTIEMLREARQRTTEPGRLALGDAARLPLRDRGCDVVFAAGLLSHLANPVLGLVELARVARSDGRLALFHPVGRAALAQKHGRSLRPDDPLDPANLPAVLAASGWEATSIDDGPDRYLATATYRA